jgi:O-antigen ligase
LIAPLSGRRGLSRVQFLLLLLFALFTSAIAIANILLALVALLWVVSLTRERRWREAFSGTGVFLLGLLIGCLALSAVFSVHPGPSLYALKGMFTFLIFPLAADLIETEADAFAVIGAIGSAAIVLALVGIWQYFHGGDNLDNRIAATLSHYMTFSGLMLLAGLASLGIALESRLHRFLTSSAAALLGSAILLSFTRNAYVGFVVAVIVYLAITSPKALPAVPVLGALIVALSPADIRSRLFSIFDPSDPTNRDRLDMAVAGGRIVRDHPVFGLGLGWVKAYYPLYRVPTAIRFRVPHLHDNVVQIAGESGLFAAAAYLAFIGFVIFSSARRLRAEREASRRALLASSVLAAVGITAAGFFEYNFGDVEVLMTTLLLIAIPFSRAFRREHP